MDFILVYLCAENKVRCSDCRQPLCDFTKSESVMQHAVNLSSQHILHAFRFSLMVFCTAWPSPFTLCLPLISTECPQVHSQYTFLTCFLLLWLFFLSAQVANQVVQALLTQKVRLSLDRKWWLSLTKTQLKYILFTQHQNHSHTGWYRLINESNGKSQGVCSGQFSALMNLGAKWPFKHNNITFISRE